MKMTIIKDDHAVYVDGVAMLIDCSSLPTNFHALQWDSVAGAGEVEFKTINGQRASNLAISSLGPYQAFLDTWNGATKLPPPPKPTPLPPVRTPTAAT